MLLTRGVLPGVAALRRLSSRSFSSKSSSCCRSCWSYASESAIFTRPLLLLLLLLLLPQGPLQHQRSRNTKTAAATRGARSKVNEASTRRSKKKKKKQKEEEEEEEEEEYCASARQQLFFFSRLFTEVERDTKRGRRCRLQSVSASFRERTHASYLPVALSQTLSRCVSCDRVCLSLSLSRCLS